MTPRVRYLFVGFALAVLLAGIGIRFWATTQGIPLLSGDSVVFLPQAVRYHENGELVNRVWEPATQLDRIGVGRMTYHGFLYPMLLSQLMGRSDYLALAGSVALVQVAAVLLFAVLLVSLMRRWQWEPTSGRLLLILFLTWASTQYVQGIRGRPEALAAIMLMGSVLLMSRTNVAWHGRIAGVGIGLVTATDPIIGVFGGIGFAIYAAWRFPPRQCSLEWVGAGGLAVIVFALCIWWYPYPFADWLVGTWRMGNHALSHGMSARQSPLFLEGMLLSEGTKTVIGFIYRSTPFLSGALSLSPGWFLVGSFPLVLWSGFRLLRRSYRTGAGPGTPVLFYLGVLIAALAIRKYVFYTSWASYNVLPLMPLGFIAIFHELGRDLNALGSNQPRISLYRPMAFLILGLTSFGLVADVYQRIHNMRHGPTLAEGREHLRAIQAEFPHAIIAVHESLFTLTEDTTNVVFWMKDDAIPPAATLLVDAQANRLQETAHVFDGFHLVRDHYNPVPPTLAGIPLKKFDRGCGFAVYHRNPVMAVAP